MQEIRIERTKSPRQKPADSTKLGFGQIFTDHMFIMNYDEGQGWHDPRIVPYGPLELDPAAVIAIDALAAYESERICTTVQITDTGIEPGSGVGNHRLGLTRDTLGVKVIAVGVPMVVYASTIARDAMARLIDAYGIYASGHDEAAQELLRQVADGFLGDMVVTPREIDELVLSVAGLLSDGINQALQPAVDEETLHTFARA